MLAQYFQMQKYLYFYSFNILPFYTKKHGVLMERIIKLLNIS